MIEELRREIECFYQTTEAHISETKWSIQDYVSNICVFFFQDQDGHSRSRSSTGNLSIVPRVGHDQNHDQSQHEDSHHRTDPVFVHVFALRMSAILHGLVHEFGPLLSKLQRLHWNLYKIIS